MNAKTLLVAVAFLLLIGSAMALEASRPVHRDHAVVDAPSISRARVIAQSQGGGERSALSYCDVQFILSKMTDEAKKENFVKSWEAKNSNRLNAGVCRPVQAYRIRAMWGWGV